MKNLKAFALVPFACLTAVSLMAGTASANNNKKPAKPSDAGKDATAVESASAKVDALIAKAWKANKVEPNAVIDDETFVRRIYLDIAGRIPTIEEAEAFHSSSYEHKRERLIDELLGSDAYVSHYYNFWADVLRISSGLSNGAPAAEAAYQLWLKDALRDNKPYNEFVYELVAGKGYLWDNGAIGYYQRDRGMPLDNMSNTVRTFLGTRLECAQCHNHPFDKWTQMDYFKMAAFSYGMDASRYDAPNRTAMSDHINSMRREAFASVIDNKRFPVVRDEKHLQRLIDNERFEQRLTSLKMTKAEFVATAEKGIEAAAEVGKLAERVDLANRQIYNQVRYFSVEENGRSVKLPHDYQYSDAEPLSSVEAATMFGAEIDLKNVDAEGIAAYGKWMTSSENPTFTKVIANRLWKKVFGHGVFEPIDELTEQTPVSNPELLAYLEQLMQDLNYDMKAYMEVLYNTETYQRAADASEVVLGAAYYFPGPRLRRMTAEQVWDSIVALALPEADSYRPRLKQQLSAVEKIHRMHAALEGRTPEEYIAMMQELGAALEANVPEQSAVREKMYVAREKDDMELYKKLRSQLGELQKGARATISEIGFKHTDQRVNADELLAAVGMNEMTMDAEGSMNMMAGDGGGDAAVLITLPKPKMPEPPKGLNKKELRNWRAQNKRDYSVYSRLVADMARASELQSPARRGHFLREFGQSDREVIENAALQASVPQALNLLNGTISEALTNRFAVFGSRLHEAGDAEQKTKMIFQAMLSRQPSDFEMELAREEITKSGDAAYESLVWSLLNTQQFLFVQ